MSRNTWKVLIPVRLTWINWCRGFLCLNLCLEFKLWLELTCKHFPSLCFTPLTLICFDVGGHTSKSPLFLFWIISGTQGSWELSEPRKLGFVEIIDGAGKSWLFGGFQAFWLNPAFSKLSFEAARDGGCAGLKNAACNLTLHVYELHRCRGCSFYYRNQI